VLCDANGMEVPCLATACLLCRGLDTTDPVYGTVN
jgi:hypothetical protein